MFQNSIFCLSWYSFLFIWIIQLFPSEEKLNRCQYCIRNWEWIFFIFFFQKFALQDTEIIDLVFLLVFDVGEEVFWREICSDGYKKALWVDVSCWQPATEAIGWSNQPCTCTGYWGEVSGRDTGDISSAWWPYRGVLCFQSVYMLSVLFLVL